MTRITSAGLILTVLMVMSFTRSAPHDEMPTPTAYQGRAQGQAQEDEAQEQQEQEIDDSIERLRKKLDDLTEALQRYRGRTAPTQEALPRLSPSERVRDLVYGRHGRRAPRWLYGLDGLDGLTP